MRLLMFGINYTPERTGIGPYTAGLASYLAQNGDRVDVVTGLPSYPEWRVHDSFRRIFWSHDRADKLTVHRRWHYVPRSQSTLRRFAYEASFLLTGLSAAFLRKPDLVVGVIPTLSGGVLARVMARRFKVPYALIFQDLMGLASSQSGVSRGQLVSKPVTMAERWVSVRATAVGIIAEGFREYFVSLGVEPQRIHRLRNWARTVPPKQDRPLTRKHLGWEDDQVVGLHAGNMGSKQGLENIIECAVLAQKREPQLRFVLMGDGNQKTTLEQLAQGHKLQNLSFLPLQPDEEFPNVLAAADILLLNQRAGVSEMALPSKLTSYFTSGRPVIAAAESQSETARELIEAKAGVVIEPDNPAALLSAVMNLACDPTAQEQLGTSGRNHAEDTLSAQRTLADLRRFLLDAASQRTESGK